MTSGGGMPIALYEETPALIASSMNAGSSSSTNSTTGRGITAAIRRMPSSASRSGRAISTSTTSGAMRRNRLGQGFAGSQPHHGQSGIRGKHPRDRAGPFRIVVRQQDFHVRASLLRICATLTQSSMPHRSTAISAERASRARFERLNKRQHVRIWICTSGIRPARRPADCRDTGSAVACGQLKETGP